MRKLLSTIIVLISINICYSQETKRDTLRTEEISVVKPYTPSISTAFKIALTPSIGNDTIKKETVDYKIFSIPVASTFTPSKGQAQRIKREPKERLYENYISAGFGNFTSPLFEAYIHHGDPRHNDLGLFVNHHSSEGGIDNVLLNDNFSDTRIDGYYTQFDRDYTWQINTGVQRQMLNYYGLPTDVVFDETLLNSLDEKQIHKTFYVGGKLSLEDSFFKGSSAELINFSDNFSSNEFRLMVKPYIELPISTELINANFLVDMVSGKFDQDYLGIDALKYSYLNLGVNPNFEVLRENLSIHLGAKIIYANDLERKTNKFYAYPNVDASFKVIDDIFILVAGVTGELTQHTYRDLVEQNPYLSPTLDIQPTDQQYRAFIGTKGKLASNVGYNLTLSHTKEINKPLFIQNQILTDGMNDIQFAYQAGNSFGLIHDDIKTLGVFGELIIDASKEFNFSGSIQYNEYTTETQNEAWNLPKVKASIAANYQNNSWFAGAKLYYNGPTKDLSIPFGSTFDQGIVFENESYIDLNLNGGYMFSDRLSAFAKINNALGKKYHRFLNYQVQTLQILGGITYKFDL